MFIKQGDGKIITVLQEEELTAEQKKALKDLSKEVIKQSDDKKSEKLES